MSAIDDPGAIPYGGRMNDSEAPRPPAEYEMVQCRKELARFVRIMEGKLTAADYKMHWRDVQAPDVEWFTQRLTAEHGELREAVHSFHAGRLKPDAVIFECADVAIFAMMIADILIEEGTP